MKILGISAYYHDSAAALVADGEIVAAAQEERFSRRKHDDRFPKAAIAWCLKAGGLDLCDLDSIVFYDKPMLKFDRLLETYLGYAPRGFASFVAAMPVWLKDKLNLKSMLRQELAGLAGCRPKDLPALYFTEHHQAHAASAFFPSPFPRAAILCLDGVGEWATTSVWLGDGNDLTPVWQINFPHSLGLLYSAFTYYTGFKVNSGEYKLMGLAPYGEPRYAATILRELIDLKPDGTFRLNMEYFNYATGRTMTNERFDRLFGGPPRHPDSPICQREMDLAASIQNVTEEAMLRLARTVHRELDTDHLCLAGGVALNCVANGRILREGPFRDIWVQPAADDAGGALGAALSYWHQYLERPKAAREGDAMLGGYLGPSFTDDEIEQALLKVGARYHKLGEDELLGKVAEKLARENVVGWFQGRMEFGPRALGARSILGDPRSPTMQSTLNLKIKYRESFRPFAPAILAERVSDYFELDRSSPYMSLVAPVLKDKRIPVMADAEHLAGIDRINQVRSTIPAVTHVDHSARIQTVHRQTNPLFYSLLKKFEELTGCPLLVNTSFNVRGEPIVCTPADAYRCFMRTEMDYLVIGSFILPKVEQFPWKRDDLSQQEFELDQERSS
ncbi:MAG: carbamoyltransferase [Candidatus Binatus sp.]|uniref:carbamoyltransferase family protein n=1 Tax=Candidatus Binatus sp. TaxID=2811406 RepID=UPI00272055C0|nr:carbamoyltransferase [Candidatus Binatus sp.]MDO8431278.1 carbamoyltransferase [Candidatus Binatus sp.]